MKHKFNESSRLLKIMLLCSVFGLSASPLFGQCQCGNNNNVNPGEGYHSYHVFQDAEGFTTHYQYTFQFSCLGEPLEQYNDYSYVILYREKGASDWLTTNTDGLITIYDPIDISADSLAPCKIYEMRVTCPECIPDPNSLYCWSDSQLERFLEDSTNTLHNVSQIWEVCFSPIQFEEIQNFRVSSVNTTEGSIMLTWDHLTWPATYTVQYRDKGDLNWIEAGTTTDLNYKIEGLESCKEYNLRVFGSITDCCGGLKTSQRSTFTFKMTECVSNILSIDQVSGNAAHVSWSPVESNANPVEYQIQWWNDSNNKMTALTSSLEYHITGLEPNKDYSVQITTICDPQICSGYSKIELFETNCDLFEPNNNFQTAMPIELNVWNTNANISPLGDIDFYKFKPETCVAEINIDQPELEAYPNPDPELYSGSDFPYFIYDHNFNIIPRINCGGFNDQGQFQNTLHWVNPGEDYYLAVYTYNRAYENCYSFKVSPFLGNEEELNNEMLSNSILGENVITQVPSTSPYYISCIPPHIEWYVSGPAEFTNPPKNGNLNFTGTGTVNLSALVSTCSGEFILVEKTISVTDPCNLEGTYTRGAHHPPISDLEVNELESLNYTISLYLPNEPGAHFFIELEDGSATWSINGNDIIVSQQTNLVKFKITQFNTGCYGRESHIAFYSEHDAPNPGNFPIAWEISPNPTTDLLRIIPSLSQESTSNPLTEGVDIRLFNQSAGIVLSRQGSTDSPNYLNLNSLIPGSYTLQLRYGTYLQQFTLVKQ